MTKSMELSALRKKINDLNEVRTDAVSKVLNLKPYIAAQVYERYKACGNSSCKCYRGELHGPFLWIYQRKKGQKVISTTIAKGKKLEAKKLAERYKNLLALRKQIREADNDVNSLLNEFESMLEKEVSEYVKRETKT